MAVKSTSVPEEETLPAIGGIATALTGGLVSANKNKHATITTPAASNNTCLLFTLLIFFRNRIVHLFLENVRSFKGRNVMLRNHNGLVFTDDAADLLFPLFQDETSKAADVNIFTACQ